MSIARASEELHVTPGAISHHIKALEGWLGERLFRRANNSLSLTPAGETYLASITPALDRISDATEKLAVRDWRNTLTIVVPPSFCSKWLVPRLSRFRKREPNLEIRISVAVQPIDFTQHMMDVGIGFGWETATMFKRVPVMTYDIYPVCSPALLKGEVPLRTLADVKHYPLIHDDGLSVHDRVDWGVFLEMAGEQNPDLLHGLRFNRADAAIDSAVQGYGIALNKSLLVIDDIKAGRLVKPFDVSIPGERTYDVIGTEPLLNSPKVASFVNWLEEEAVNDGMSANVTDIAAQ